MTIVETITVNLPSGTTVRGTMTTMTTTTKTTKTAKRVRPSQQRDANFSRGCQTISSTFNTAVQAHRPLHTVFREVLNYIDLLDVTHTQKQALHQRLWAVRDFVVTTQARWQLYLKFDKRLAVSGTRPFFQGHDGAYYYAFESREISALREAGDSNIWSRCHGRHEWKDSMLPFYDQKDPAYCGPGGTGVTTASEDARAADVAEGTRLSAEVVAEVIDEEAEDATAAPEDKRTDYSEFRGYCRTLNDDQVLAVLEKEDEGRKRDPAREVHYMAARDEANHRQLI